MAFIETRFPVDIAYGSAGGPQYSTDIIMTAGGHEQRNQNWSAARLRYNVAYGVRTSAQLDTLLAFFRARKGRADGFRFKDWSDYKATGQLIGNGDASTTQFQLVKTYTSGGVTETRTISKPVSGTVKIYLAGVLQTTGYSVSTTSGMVTFSSAPANGTAITADFEFDVPVRFDTDRLSAALENYGTATLSDIPVIELRV